MLQSKTTHPSSQNVNYGLCNGSGEDLNGHPVCNLCSYSKQDSTEGAESVRHMSAELHDVAKRVFAVAIGVCRVFQFRASDRSQGTSIRPWSYAAGDDDCLVP